MDNWEFGVMGYMVKQRAGARFGKRFDVYEGPSMKLNAYIVAMINAFMIVSFC